MAMKFNNELFIIATIVVMTGAPLAVNGRESSAPVTLKDYQKLGQTPVINNKPTAIIKGKLVYMESGAPVNPNNLKNIRQLGVDGRTSGYADLSWMQ
jgi:hypothetical protein